MTPVGVFFCWQGGAERDFVNSTILSHIFNQKLKAKVMLDFGLIVVIHRKRGIEQRGK